MILTPTEQHITFAADALRKGKLVGIPTETVYGVAANATHAKAVEAIFEAKGRPSHNPLIVHVSSLNEAEHYVEFSAMAKRLAKAFWPGPLTLVLPLRTGAFIAPPVMAGLHTLAIRVPEHAVMQQLLQAVDFPLAAPSANRSGKLSPTNAAHVEEELGDSLACIINGGSCKRGVESTILYVEDGLCRLLRPGSITTTMIDDITSIRADIELPSNTAILAPGMLLKHYAPTIPIRLNALNVEKDEALLAFGSMVPEGAAKVLNLSKSGNVEEAASNLFAYLRILDKPEFARIAVMPIPEDSTGVAINDRLKRAASK